MQFKNRKGISPLIASLLLIAIAVAASVLTYSWVMSMVGNQSQQAQTQIRVEDVAWTISSNGADTAAISVRNTGSVSANIESIGIKKNIAGEGFKTCTLSGSTTIDQGVVGSFTWSSASAVPTITASYIALSTSYVIRVTTNTGFYYELVATTPAS